MPRVSMRTGQVVIPELVDELSPRLLGYLLHDWAGKHLRAEDRGDARFPDLIYQSRDVSRGGLCEV